MSPSDALHRAMRAQRAPNRIIRIRVAAAALLCALGLFLALGHGLHLAPMDEHGAMSDVSVICLVLFTVIAPLALALPALARRVAAEAPVAELAAFGLPRLELPTPPARGSPTWLQRFLN